MTTPTFWNPESVVNSSTGGRQWASRVVSTIDGGYAVLFDSVQAENNDKMRLFNGNGGPNSNEFFVPPSLADSQNSGDVTVLPNGNIVATWMEAETTIPNGTAYFRIFSWQGNPLTPPIKINGSTYFGTDPNAPKAIDTVTLSNGDFVIAWPSGLGLKVRTYNADGSPNPVTTTLSSASDIGLSARPGGGFVVTYQDSSGSDPNVFMQLFKPDGSKSGSPVILHDDPAASQYQTDITCLANGKMLATWGSSTDNNVHAKLFNSNGTAASEEITLKGTEAQYSTHQSVVALLDGRVLVVYVGYDPTVSNINGNSIYGRIINADGRATESEFLIQNSGLNDQFEHLPSAAVLTDGRVVVTWDDARADYGQADSNIRSVILDPREVGINIQSANHLNGKMNSIFHGTAFNDSMKGGVGRDTIFGHAGDDSLMGKSGTDTIYGNQGNDTLLGDSGVDTLNGGEDNDTLSGGIGNDKLNGGSGSDTASFTYHVGSGGLDITLIGGWAKAKGTLNSDADTLINIENIIASSGRDNVIGSHTDNIIRLGNGNDNCTLNNGNDQGFGGSGNDKIWGNRGDDSLYGNNGVDTLNGGDGQDLIVGGAGADLLTGGAGVDRFYCFQPTDGTDTITDFSELDLFVFEASAFGFGATTGPLDAAVLQVGANKTAANTDVRFIFATGDDTLWYDADGKGGTAARLIVDLSNDYRTMSADDIVLV